MNKLKETRKRLNITQADLSAALNIGQGLISLYERGVTSPSIKKADIIFKFLQKLDKQVTFSELWGVGKVDI